MGVVLLAILSTVAWTITPVANAESTDAEGFDVAALRPGDLLAVGERVEDACVYPIVQGYLVPGEAPMKVTMAEEDGCRLVVESLTLVAASEQECAEPPCLELQGDPGACQECELDPHLDIEEPLQLPTEGEQELNPVELAAASNCRYRWTGSYIGSGTDSAKVSMKFRYGCGTYVQWAGLNCTSRSDWHRTGCWWIYNYSSSSMVRRGAYTEAHHPHWWNHYHGDHYEWTTVTGYNSGYVYCSYGWTWNSHTNYVVMSCG